MMMNRVVFSASFWIPSFRTVRPYSSAASREQIAARPGGSPLHMAGSGSCIGPLYRTQAMGFQIIAALGQGLRMGHRTCDSACSFSHSKAMLHFYIHCPYNIKR